MIYLFPLNCHWLRTNYNIRCSFLFLELEFEWDRSFKRKLKIIKKKTLHLVRIVPYVVTFCRSNNYSYSLFSKPCTYLHNIPTFSRSRGSDALLMHRARVVFPYIKIKDGAIGRKYTSFCFHGFHSEILTIFVNDAFFKLLFLNTINIIPPSSVVSVKI